MIRYKDRNDSVQRQIQDINNCHCSYRLLFGEHRAKAYDNVTNQVRASISWRHYPNRTVITWNLSLGVKFQKVFLADATEAKIDEVITAGFVQMDEAWKTNNE